ncbi:unnamed protein product [Closterium sp. Yama58-4]|nr:unnamed protein product [Closterium sp. Yama58-4]
MLVLAIFISSFVAATPVLPITSAASNKYAFVPATNSLLFGNGYSVTWGATGITSAVDSHGAPLKAVKNPADGSVTVDGAYTAYPNGTLTGPGIVIVISGTTAGFSMGKTTFLKSGTIVDASGKPVVPTANADGSYTAGDLKGWSNGTIVGPGASIYLGAPLTLNPNGTVGFVAASSNYSYNPTANSLTFGNNYTVTWSETEKLTSAVDSTGGKLKGTNNRDGSSTIDGVYTAYGNGTLTGSGIVIVISGPTAGFTMGKTTFLKNATIVDASGTPVVSSANADGSYTAGGATAPLLAPLAHRSISAHRSPSTLMAPLLSPATVAAVAVLLLLFCLLQVAVLLLLLLLLPHPWLQVTCYFCTPYCYAIRSFAFCCPSLAIFVVPHHVTPLHISTPQSDSLVSSSPCFLGAGC